MSNDQNDSPSSPGDFSQGASDIGQNFGHLGEGTYTTMSVLAHDPTIGSAGGFKTPASPPLEAALEFRVVRPGAPVRRLRLTGNRYTFGSGEGCSIRLDDPSLRPMHAVLLRDTQRILMRAYSVPLEHNGSRVTEAVLKLGDIIRMGTYRFELLSAPGKLDTTGSLRNTNPAHQDPALRDTALKDRLTELSQQWHARHAECEARERRCDQRESALHGRETELWSRVENLQRRENVLLAQEAAVREIQQTYAATQEELRELREREDAATETLKEKEAELELKSRQLQERKAELERRQEEWKQREDQFEQRTAEAQQQLEQAREKANAASDAVGRMREEFSSLNEQLTELRERHSELQQREKREQAEHERLRGELEATRDAAVEAHAKSESLREESEARRRDGEARREETEQELRRVTAELDSTRQEMAQLRDESREYQETLNQKLQASSQDLQAAREEAERSRRSAEEEQAYAEKRLLELEEQLSGFQEKHKVAESVSLEQLTKLQQKHEEAEAGRIKAEEERVEAEEGRKEAERIASELREDIDELRESVAKATDEASQLKIDNEGANASIRQLELLVDQTKNNQSAQQDSWSYESEQLQKTIEDLSVQLASANAELGQLRTANEALTNELRGAQQEIESQPDLEQSILHSDQFQTLEKELESARQEIERLQDTHAETVARIEAERKESESALRDEIEQLREEITTAQESAEARIREITEAAQSASVDVSVETFEPETAKSDDWQASDAEANIAEANAAQVNESEVAPHEDLAERLEEGSLQAGLTELEASDHTEADADEVEAELLDAQAAADDSIVVDESDQLVESGESIWRLEGVFKTDERTDEPAENPETVAESDSELQHTVQLENEPQPESFQDPSGDESSQQLAAEPEAEDVSWHDEAPEHAVSDVIEDIEHNLEQAISGYQPPAESPWGDSVAETPEPESTTEATIENDAVEGEVLEGEVAEYPTEDAEAYSEEPSNLDSEDQSDEPERPMSDTEVVRQFASRPDSDSPLNWSAYMPGGTGEEEPASDVDGEVSGEDSGDVNGEADATLEEAGAIPADESSDELSARHDDWNSESNWTEQSIADAHVLEEQVIDQPVDEQEQTQDQDHISESIADGESIAESGWDASSWNEDEGSPSQHEQSELLENVEDSIEAEAPIAESQPYEMTEEWSGPESVEGFAETSEGFAESHVDLVEEVQHESTAESAVEPVAEASAWNTDLAQDAGTEQHADPEQHAAEEIEVSQVLSELGEAELGVSGDDELESPESELAQPEYSEPEYAESDSDADQQLTAEPEEEAAQPGGSLAEMLIRDLSSDSDEPTSDHASPAEGTLYESEMPASAIESATPEEEDDSIDPTFVLQSEINFAEEGQDDVGGSWNFDSPSESLVESDAVEDAPVGFEPIEEIEEDVSQTAVAPENDTVVAPEEAAEDDSIEAYMSRLLQRVQGGSEEPAPAAPPAKAPEPQESAPEAIDESIEAEPEIDPLTDSGEASLKDSVPLVPRSQAPELSRNLSAMRELANQSARNAVARSIRVQARDTQMKAVFKGAFAVGFVAMAIGVYIFVQWSATIKFAMVGAFLVLAGVFAQEAYVLARDAKRRLALAESSTGDAKDDKAIAEEIQRIAEEAQENS